MTLLLWQTSEDTQSSRSLITWSSSSCINVPWPRIYLCASYKIQTKLILWCDGTTTTCVKSLNYLVPSPKTAKKLLSDFLVTILECTKSCCDSLGPIFSSRNSLSDTGEKWVNPITITANKIIKYTLKI